jgi:hypothetical protein
LNVPSEHEEQVLFVQWFRRQYPSVLIFAIPNGGVRGKIAAAKLKAEGVKRGIPDLYVPEWKLWIEMKRVKGGRLSKDQRDVLRYLEDFDTTMVCLGFEDAKKQVREFVAKQKEAGDDA